MRILSNGRIGIGTNNPGAYALSVSGTTFFSQAVDMGSGRSITFQNPGLANGAGLLWSLPSDSA